MFSKTKEYTAEQSHHKYSAWELHTQVFGLDVFTAHVVDYLVLVETKTGEAPGTEEAGRLDWGFCINQVDGLQFCFAHGISI